MHNNVKNIDFSPCERYLVTSTWADRPNDKEEPEAVIIWDVRTGEKKRAFKNEGPKDKPMEPFKWSVSLSSSQLNSTPSRQSHSLCRSRVNSMLLKLYRPSRFLAIDLGGGAVRSFDGQYFAKIATDSIQVRREARGGTRRDRGRVAREGGEETWGESWGRRGERDEDTNTETGQTETETETETETGDRARKEGRCKRETEGVPAPETCFSSYTHTHRLLPSSSDHLLSPPRLVTRCGWARLAD
eukprot:1060632-Rhodomonas_salina.2